VGWVVEDGREDVKYRGVGEKVEDWVGIFRASSPPYFCKRSSKLDELTFGLGTCLLAGLLEPDETERSVTLQNGGSEGCKTGSQSKSYTGTESECPEGLESTYRRGNGDVLALRRERSRVG
jgi:hypothetical protein